MSIYARLSILLAILLAILAGLAALYWKGFTNGEKSTQAKWDAEKIQLQAKALEAQEANAETARLARKSVERLDHDLQTARKARDAASAVDADSVRKLDAAIGHPTRAEASAASGIDGDPTDAILRQCIRQVAGMAEEARGLESQAKGLSRYTREVCLK